MEKIEQALLNPELETQWQSVIDSMDISDQKKASNLAWVRALRDDFLRIARDVTDESELYTVLAVRYIELKCHWIMLNTQIQYQTFRRGMADQNVVIKASLTTSMLSEIEPLIPQDDIDNINRFLSEPVSKQGHQETDKIIDRDEGLDEITGIEENTTEMEETTSQAEEKDMAENEQTPEMIESMESQLTTLYDEKEKLIEGLGTGDADNIINMVRSMEEQLKSFYQEKDFLEEEDKRTEAVEPPAPPASAESMDEQLNSLYAERDFMAQEIGISDGHGIVEMVRSLEAQLVDLYEEREDAVIIEGSKITIYGPKRVFVKKKK